MYRLKMILLLCIEGYFSDLLQPFFQNDFNFTHERIEVFSFNSDYGKLTVKNFKYNRTVAALNGSLELRKQLYNNLRLEIQAYRFASNEYRLFPMRFAYSACEAFRKNDVGIANMINCGNFTGCPLLVSTYHICNWTPDGSRLPPHIPDGSYMIDVNLTDYSNEVGRVRWYGTVKSKSKLY